MTDHKTREAWLQAFIAKARPIFAKAGSPLPASIRVAIGFASTGRKGKRIGECWYADSSADKHCEIFIVPSLSDASRIADILTHELVHAALPVGAKHGPLFKALATSLGLTGKMTSTVAGEEWHRWADPIVNKLGPLPHGALMSGTSSGPKKQNTRMLKVTCTGCGFVFRTTAKWLDGAADLQCPDASCGEACEVE